MKKNLLFLAALSVLFLNNASGYEPQKKAELGNTVITKNDLNSRVALILFLTQKEYNKENISKVEHQALKNLIDEVIYINEAAEKLKKYGQIDNEDIDEYIENIAKHNRMNKEGFLSALKEYENKLQEQVDIEESFRQQIRAQIAWSRISENFASPVTDKEVDQLHGEIDKNNQSTLYDISEISIPFSNDRDKKRALEISQYITSELSKGASFYTLAQQFSRSSNAANGGSMGRVSLAQLDKTMKNHLINMANQDVKTIETPGKIQIIKLNKIIMRSGENTIYLSLRIASIPITKELSNIEELTLNATLEKLKASKSEQEFLNTCSESGYQVEKLNDIVLEQVQPEEFRELLKRAKENTVIPDIPAEGGVQFVFVAQKNCGENIKISKEEIKRMLQNKKRNDLTQMYFNKLKGRILAKIYN